MRLTVSGISWGPVVSIALVAVVVLTGLIAMLFVRGRKQLREAEDRDAQIRHLTDEVARLHDTEAALQKARDAAEAANLAKTR